MTEPNDQIASEQPRVENQPSSVSEVSSFENPTSSTGGGIPRVRFFTDIEGSGSSTPEGISGREMLTIDTSSSNTSPREEIRSLGRVGDIAETQIPTLHHSSASSSPRKRNRGYSLRRQVLFKNVHDQTDEDVGVTHSSANDTGVELTSAPGTSSKGQSTDKGANHNHIARNNLSSVASSFPHYTIWARKRSYTLRGQIRLYCTTARNFLLRNSGIPPSGEGRRIPVDTERKTPLIDENTGNEYTSNTIRSSRYTIWSFFPRQLFAQFSKLANL